MPPGRELTFACKSAPGRTRTPLQDDPPGTPGLQAPLLPRTSGFTSSPTMRSVTENPVSVRAKSRGTIEPCASVRERTGVLSRSFDGHGGDVHH